MSSLLLLIAACGSDADPVEQADEPVDSGAVATSEPDTPEELEEPEDPAAPEAPAETEDAEIEDAATEVEIEGADATESVASDGLWPEVVGAQATTSDGATWRFDVTLLSEYDSPERYADAWRVLDANDLELGIRVLAHDHAGEQPFTRSTSIEIPVDISTVFIEGRDQVNGWSGERYELTLER